MQSHFLVKPNLVLRLGWGFDNMKLLDSVIGNDSACVDDVMDMFENVDMTCDCNPACVELDYEIIISEATWPSKQYTV